MGGVIDRHDPFESVWALSVHGEYDCMADHKHGDQAQKVELRKRAWALWDLACKVLGPIITGQLPHPQGVGFPLDKTMKMANLKYNSSSFTIVNYN